MLNRIILAAFVAAAAVPAHAEELTAARQAEKQADIKRLMDITSGGNMATQFADSASQQLFRAIRSSHPDFPERAQPIINRELLAIFSDKISAQGGLMDQIVPVYDKHFTHAEIRELLRFYQTPVGRKTVASMPKVLGETIQIRLRWAQALGPEVDRRVGDALKKEGLAPAPAASAPPAASAN